MKLNFLLTSRNNEVYVFMLFCSIV